MRKGSPIVVFDFDLTLTRWDTAERFFLWLLKREPWRLGLVLVAVPALGPLFLVNATRKWPVRFAVWVATLARSERDLDSLAHEHVEAIFAGPESVFLQAGLMQLQSHLEQEHRVVIATGCLELLAQKLLRRVGYGHVPLVASTLRSYLGGMVRRQHCVGSNKIRMLSERGFGPPWAVAYTDHRSDLPVLEHSDKWFLISPKAECIRHIERALAVKANVLVWR